MALEGGLFAFAKNPTPTEPEGSYRSAALTLKVFGWVALVGTILTVLVLILAGIFMMMFGAWFSEAASGWDAGLGGFLGSLMMVMMLFGAVVVLALGIGAVAWTSWIFLRFLERDPRALGHMLVLGIVLLVLAGLGLLSALSAPMGAMPDFDGETTTGFAFNLPVFSIAQLVFGILFVVFASKEDLKATFGTLERPDQEQVAPPQQE